MLFTECGNSQRRNSNININFTTGSAYYDGHLKTSYGVCFPCAGVITISRGSRI